MSCCKYKTFGGKYKDICIAFLQPNPKDDVLHITKIPSNITTNSMVICAKSEGYKYYNPILWYGSYTYFHNYDTQRKTNNDFVIRLYSKILESFGKSQYKFDDVIETFKLNYNMRLSHNLSNEGLCKFKGRILITIPCKNCEIVPLNTNVFKGLIMPKMSITKLSNIFIIVNDTNLFNPLAFDEEPLKGNNYEGQHHEVDKDKYWPNEIALFNSETLYCHKKYLPRRFKTLKFESTIRLMIWIYSLITNNLTPVICGIHNYMICEQPNDECIYGINVRKNNYIVPQLARCVNTNLENCKFTTYTRFVIYYIFILRQFVGYNREFTSCVCYLQRFLTEKKRTINEIADFLILLDVYKENHIQIENYLFNPSKIKYKLNKERTNICDENGKDLYISDDDKMSMIYFFLTNN